MSKKTTTKVAQKVKGTKLYIGDKYFTFVLAITGVIGLIASFVLVVDKIHVLKDPTYNPSCNINPIFSCGSVMKSSQAEIFGVPNALIGVVAFAMVIAIAGAILAGAKLQHWFWRLWLVGLAGGIGGIAYLFFQSVFRLQTLCIFCMTVWTVLIALAWYSLLWCAERGVIRVPAKVQPLYKGALQNHLGVLALLYMLIIAFIVYKFWYYFGTL